MALKEEDRVKSLRDLEENITKALEKVGGKSESDICKYLPGDAGGYMHHFTLRKLKNEKPELLRQKIKEFITSVDRPQKVAPKSRAPRGTRKRKEHIVFTKADMEKMLHIARFAGDKDMVAKLAPRKSLAAVKKDLVSKIRRNIADVTAWATYVEAVGNHVRNEEVAKTNPSAIIASGPLPNTAGRSS